MNHINQIGQHPNLLVGTAFVKHPSFLLCTCAGFILGGIVLLTKKLLSNKSERLDNVETTLNEPLDLQNIAEISENERLKQPLKSTVSTVDSAVESTVESTVTNRSDTVESLPEVSSEDIEKELIRRAMSELGKRSAQKRREIKE